jgi:beta-galactosidase/beta-glucuronidase
MIETPLRPRLDISAGWDFVRGRVRRRWLSGRGETGEHVNLPHCWNRGDTFQLGRRSYSGRGAYRRQLDLPAKPEGTGNWKLRSEGFYGFGDVWVDGRTTARVDGQYMGFDIDLPVSLPAGSHILAVRLENLWQRRILPGRRDPDFLLYGGLAGRVWLEWVPAFHIDRKRVEVVCTQGPEGAEIVELRCGTNGSDTFPEKPRISWSVSTTDGEQVAAAGPVPIDDGDSAISTLILNPRCWSPSDPQLYWAEGLLETDTGAADVVRVRFGITRSEFRPDEGFFLDGRRVDLHGCNRHESIPGLGNALPEELDRADARLLKDYGCNFVRLSHYPQHPAFLDACDELGMMVYAEIASWKSVSSSSAWRRAARRQMRDLILRDRHHPSVIVWGMGNESRSRIAYVEMREIARDLDPVRPVTYAENHLYRASREKTVGIPDVWSVNYEIEVLEEARNSCSLRNVILSECCNYPHSVRGDDRAELIQVATLEYEWKLMAERPYLAGHAVWSFTDYATEYRKRYRRQTGLFDAWRRPKMAAELFRARYAEEPFVSLFVTGANDYDRELHVFSNCERIVLESDGAPAVELEGQLHHIVSLEGPLTGVRAEATRNGVIVRNELHAWREAHAVAINVDKAEAKTGWTIPVDLTVCDDAGTPVRDWNGHIEVDVDGDAQLFPYTDAGEVLISRGQGRTYAEIGRSGGEFVIHAATNGLEPGSVKLFPRS